MVETKDLLDSLADVSSRLASQAGTPSAGFTAGKSTVGVGAALIVAANPARKSVELFNSSNTVTVYLGPLNTVTDFTGAHPGKALLPQGFTTMEHQGPVYGIAASNVDVGYAEE